MFVFDDVLDLSLAKEVGARFMIKREASKILREYVIHNGWVDFATQLEGQEHAVRAICEFVLDCMGIFKKTIDCRIGFGEDYQTYWQKRQSIETNKMTVRDFELVSE
jgi:3-deoxy-D-manno-octulosonate 8-phosphate phosphatase (KDO 8-P phosphatase)